MMQKVGNEATSQSVIKHFHQVGLDEAWAKRRCRSILAANFTSWVGACAEILGPFKHLLRVTPPSIFGLSSDHQWLLAWDNTVMSF